MMHACVIHSLLRRAPRTVVQVLGSVRLPRGPIHLVEDLHVHERSRSIVVLHFLMTRVNPFCLPSSRACTAQLCAIALRLLFADPPAAVTVGVDDTGLSVKDLPPPSWSSIRNQGPRDRSASGTRSRRMSPSPNKCRLAQSP